ncbi:melanoregulin [Aulostomus maculatus]
MGAKYTVCCCRYYLKYNTEEKNAILRTHSSAASRPPQPVSSESSDSDTGEQSLFGPQHARNNPWKDRHSHRSSITNPPGDPAVRQGSDRELQALISMRDQTDQATEEWEKLNFDIHTLRYTRREIRSRWKKILLQQGYQCEVDALLSVNRQSQRISRDQEQLSRANDLLTWLLDHTSLFPPGTDHHSKYIYVMDRLVSLDSADDFVRLATEKYPKKEG